METLYQGRRWNGWFRGGTRLRRWFDGHGSCGFRPTGLE
jgi:hypothetical protein